MTFEQLRQCDAVRARKEVDCEFGKGKLKLEIVKETNKDDTQK